MSVGSPNKSIEEARAEFCAIPELAGYRILRRIGQGGSGVVYEAEAPGGFSKAVKVVEFARNNPLTEREIEGLRAIRSIRHPYLVSIDRVDVDPHRITLVMELADGNLREMFRECTASGDLGIPRERLLPLVAEAAEALDVLNLKYRVHHLDVKPENLFVFAEHVKVGDYGLVREAGRKFIDPADNAVTPAYAAPEMFDSAVSDSSDQYSLAVVYLEMATGQLPYRTANVRQLALYHLTRPVDVSLLPAAERPVLTRALSRNPRDRYPSCLDFVRALIEAANAAEAGNRRVAAPTLHVSLGQRRVSNTTRVIAPSQAETMAELERDKRATRQQMLVTRLPLDKIVAGIKELAERWQAEWLDFAPSFVGVRLQTRSDWFRHQVGLSDSLLAGVNIYKRGDTVLLDVAVSHHGKQPDEAAFHQHALGVVEAIRQATEAEPASERANARREPRVPVQCAVTVLPAAGLMRNMPIPCTAINYSAHGLGVVSMVPIETGDVRLRFPHREALARCRVVYSHPDPDRRYFYVGLELLSETVEPGWLNRDAEPSAPV